jgi:hypothetical protein
MDAQARLSHRRAERLAQRRRDLVGRLRPQPHRVLDRHEMQSSRGHARSEQLLPGNPASTRALDDRPAADRREW